MNLDNIKGKEHRLEGVRPSSLGQSVGEVCCWCCKLLPHPLVLMNAEIIRRGKRLPPARDSSADGFHFIKLIPGGGITHIRDLQMWWLSRCVSLLSYWGGQTATPSSLALKSGVELQAPGLLQSMENSAASPLSNTACG